MKSAPRNKRLYKKAKEILMLSKNISNYLVHDFTSLQKNGTEHPHIYFTGDIIRQSNDLVPRIIKAESELFQDDRIRHANSLMHITNKLYKNCERLEQSESNGRDFLILLRKELKKFKHMHHSWLMTL